MTDKTLIKLIKISNTTGRDAGLVQGSGGNTSVKTEDGRYMYIKASGAALKDMNAKRGWRRLRVESVLAILKDKEIARLNPVAREAGVAALLDLSCDDGVKGAARPSVESAFHSVLGRCVIHLHPVAVGAYVCAKNGESELARLFRGEKYPPVWVAYADPGYMLARKISRLAGNYQNRYGIGPAVLFLEKHGLIVSANTPDAALRLVRKVVRHCANGLKRPRVAGRGPAGLRDISSCRRAVRRGIFEATGRYVTVSYFMDNTVAAFLAHKDAPKLLMAAAVSASELLYGGGPALWLESCDAKEIARKLGRRIEKGQRPASALLVRDIGLFVAGGRAEIPVIKEATVATLFVRYFAAGLGGLKTLTKRQQEFIIRLESADSGAGGDC